MTTAYYMYVVGERAPTAEHTTRESAEAEAVRVLRKNGGGKARVVALVSEIVQAKAVFPDVVVTTREEPAAAPASETPWYPDDSGEWIEHDGVARPVDGETLVDVLLSGERDQRIWTAAIDQARYFGWAHKPWGNRNVVAYRIVDVPKEPAHAPF